MKVEGRGSVNYTGTVNGKTIMVDDLLSLPFWLHVRLDEADLRQLAEAMGFDLVKK